MILAVSLLAVAVYLVYLFFTWKFGHWKSRGITESKAWPLFGSYPGSITAKQNIVKDVETIYHKYKSTDNFVGTYNTRNPELIILDPQLAKEVYVTKFKNFHDNRAGALMDKTSDSLLLANPFLLAGEDWKVKRSEITPGLTTNRAKSTYPIMLEACSKLVKFLLDQSKNQPENGFDAKDLSLRYTSEVVSDTLYGIEAGSFNQSEPAEIHKMAQNIFKRSFFANVYFLLSGMCPFITRFVKSPLLPKKVETFFVGVMDQAIKHRLESKNDRPDFLNYLLDLQKKKNLNHYNMAAHSLTFLVDGFETTASVIAHTLLLLGRNPECQKKLRAEIMENLEGDGHLSFDKLCDLPYIEMCIHESMRLYPILMSSKVCSEPCEFTNKNGEKSQIKVGDVIVVPIYALHKDKDIYPSPEEFIPERFSEANGGSKKYKEAGVFFPFGDGPRICLGNKIATPLVKSAVVEIVKNFQINLNPITRTDNKIDLSFFMAHLDGGIWLNFEPLKKSI